MKEKDINGLDHTKVITFGITPLAVADDLSGIGTVFINAAHILFHFFSGKIFARLSPFHASLEFGFGLRTDKDGKRSLLCKNHIGISAHDDTVLSVFSDCFQNCWIRHEDFYPAIITKEEWQQTQELLKQNARPANGNRAAHRYAGLLTCANAGK